MERSWFAARRAVAGRRSNSRAAAAIDILAAAPLASAVSIAAGLGMAVKNAAALLDEFCASGIAVEVTHRSRWRLFGLAGLARLRGEVEPRRRAEPGRGRGRPRVIRIEAEPPPPVPERPLTPVERKAIDYSELNYWMAHAERVIRDTRRTLDAFARGDELPAAEDRFAEREESGADDDGGMIGLEADEEYRNDDDNEEYQDDDV